MRLFGLSILAAVSASLACTQPPAEGRLALVAFVKAACREAPSSAAVSLQYLRTGDVVHYTATSRAADGPTWLRDNRSGGCWVDSTETLPLDGANPSQAVAALADTVLARNDTSFAQVAPMIDFLEASPSDAPTAGGQSLAASFPILAARRLQLIDKATSIMDPSSPLAQAWIPRHRPELDYFEPDAAYRVSAAAYWTLVDANRSAPWVESFAVIAANKTPGTDECEGDCFLGLVLYGPAQYWRRFPQGPHLGEMVARAEGLLRAALPVGGNEPPTLSNVAAIRESLAGVAAADKVALISLLTELEKTAR